MGAGRRSPFLTRPGQFPASAGVGIGGEGSRRGCLCEGPSVAARPRNASAEVSLMLRSYQTLEEAFKNFGPTYSRARAREGRLEGDAFNL